MMRDALVIYRKELRNLIKDKRTLFSTLILPLMIIPIIFIGMGTVIGSMEKDAKESVYRIAIDGTSDPRFAQLLGDLLEYEMVPDTAAADVAITFNAGYIPGSKGIVTIVYDSSSQKTQYARGIVSQAIGLYDTVLATELLAQHNLTLADLTTLETHVIDTAPEAAQSGGSMLAMMVPYFLIIFLFAGSMGTGLDTTSGEKERGSLAALLVNQVSRTSIAWGKILYVMTIATASSAATFLGMLISLALPGGNAMFGGATLGANAFGTLPLVVILLALFFTALLTAALITLLGSLARTIKEGTSYVMPLYMIVVLIGVITMYMDPSKNTLLFLVPFVNTIFTLKEGFMGMSSVVHVVLMCLSNLVCAAACGYAVSRLFNSEKILQAS